MQLAKALEWPINVRLSPRYTKRDSHPLVPVRGLEPLQPASRATV
ncbi:hypothetical protein CFL01nite_12470 [Corynebacterium flavescens]|uniref:Transposase n=1 Tax=Corynebacterium flavescens TaxID=28028 RepID=A0AB73B8I0_CORFL|nr:hypothetical protein CFL01nite_12470 [Corynebacterium flavescens]